MNILKINPEGLVTDREGAPLSEAKDELDVLKNLRRAAGVGFESTYKGKTVLIEAFDQPLIAQDVLGFSASQLQLSFLNDFQLTVPTQSLCLDEWDRFIGKTDADIPFVLSKSAQEQLFNMADGFDDDSITIDGTTIPTPTWYEPSQKVQTKDFWSARYLNNETGWEMGGPHPSLEFVHPQLKLNKSRVLVVGAGRGHDAAFFAKQGHIVTAVDFSEEAIREAKERYGDLPITWIQKDIFQLVPEYTGQFDVVFEHTCFCAISPSRRNDYVRLVSQLLCENGYLLGVFFVFDKRTGPPFGGSEWELEQRFKRRFRPLYWTRWTEYSSTPDHQWRRGGELIAFFQKYTESH